MRKSVLLGLLASVGGVAQAADKPLYQPAPSWVTAAPAIDAAKLDDTAPVLLVNDHQDRLADGVDWSYIEFATRLATPEVVAQAGTLSIPWQPSKGDLIVHKVEIIRGGQRVDVLAGGKHFEVIRREQQLEQRQLDGMLTATMAVEGLQVGDILRVVVSVTRKETAFGPVLEAVTPLPGDPLRVGFSRARLVWPTAAGVHWRAPAGAAKPVVTQANGTTEVVLTGVLPKEPDLPQDAPARFHRLPIMEASSFADWAAVSRANAPLYATDGQIKPGGALDAEVKRIAAADADPLHRAADALQLVQEKVRYLFNGLDHGNYVPQTPEQTWALRYGDCKAKTLLLLSILRALGIEAEPTLANVMLGDLLPDRLPSAAAFNHVLVHATIAGKPYWLDGTGSGARFADLGDTPPLRWVLPIRADGAGLLAVPARAPARASASIVLDVDQSAGLHLPSLLHALVKVRGPAAAMVGLAKTQGNRDQQKDLVAGLLGKAANAEVAVTAFSLAYDPAEGMATVDVSGVASTPWSRRDGRFHMPLDHGVGMLDFSPDRARPAWAMIPVATGTPDAAEFVTRVHLPAGVSGVTLDGDAALNATLAGTTIVRHSQVTNGMVTVEEQVSSTGAEIAPGDVAAARARVALAKSRLVEAVTPAQVPTRWAMVQAAQRGGLTKPLLAAYGQAIAAEPDKAEGYVNRANFLAGIYDWRSATADLDKAITLEPTAALYIQRAYMRRVQGNTAGAAADAEAARGLDSTSYAAIDVLGEIDVDAGRKDAAIARVQERIDAGGEARNSMVMLKADLLARAGDSAGAIATMDQAIAAKPGLPNLLNERCWLKAELNIALDTALKDCTHAIELSDSPAHILDSRALVYLRLNRLDDASADLAAALENDPDQTASLYLRGVVHSRRGEAAAAKDDLAAVALMSPTLAADYKRYGIVP